MSDSDRILSLTGDSNFNIIEKKVDQMSFRNVISITNSVELEGSSHTITSSTFTLKSTTNYQDLYVDFTKSWLRFKIPSKNMLIRVDQSRLDLTKKIISSLRMSCNYVDSDGIWSNTYLTLRSLEFITYKNTSGIVTFSQCIPEYYYINNVSRINITTGVTIPAGDLTLDFYQFD